MNNNWINDLEQWITYVTGIVGDIASAAWGVPSIIILVGTGLFLTIRMKFIQFRGFKHAIELVAGKHDKKDDPGEVSHFQALTAALSATVGTGNIAGVAMAIGIGGPGALFWMWITALVGMASKYTSCTLAIKYRMFHPDGTVSGGPMHTLKNGLKMPTLATLFALFAFIASFGIGNLVQANSVVSGLTFIMPDIKGYKWIIGLILTGAVGLVIIGGFKRIAHVASYIVPFMAILYTGAALIILVLNSDQIILAFQTIFLWAFNPPAVGGGVLGASVSIGIGEAMRHGVARGVFSNESGLGSAPMAHATAKTKEPVREGLVASLEPFIDTIVICTMTGLVIVIMGINIMGITKPEDWGDVILYVIKVNNLEGASLSAFAFKEGLGQAGSWIVSLGLVFFAYSTVITWSYYGDRSAEFLFGEKAVLPYRIVYTIIVFIGAVVPIKLVWNLSDITNILMALPNLISLVLLAGLVKKWTDKYFSEMKQR